MGRFSMEDFAVDMMKAMPPDKKAVLKKALLRNFALTSAFILENGIMHVYKEGWYLELCGTRSGFKAWAYDNDGEFVFGRKPFDKKLHKLHDKWLHFNEGHYDWLDDPVNWIASDDSILDYHNGG